MILVFVWLWFVFRDYFQERVGECVVQMTSLSKDKDGFFVALKFKTAAIAESVLERYCDLTAPWQNRVRLYLS